jgi:diadenosine tetraphosphate (Ap4A) HIT family hydrolase
VIASYRQMIDACSDAPRHLYEIFSTLWEDVPFGITGTNLDFEAFVAEELDENNFVPAGTMIALDGDRWVGLAALGRGAGFLLASMTGIVRDWRGRGLARWLKLHTIRYALDAGSAELRTINDATNPAILALNRSLGFADGDRRPLPEGSLMKQAGCELCEHDGGTLVVSDARLRVVLVDEASYPGFTRVIWRDHVREMSELEAGERQHLMDAVIAVELALRKVLAPLKVNLASLGNMTPHLHWHVIPRFADDPHFPHPIWRPLSARRTRNRSKRRAELGRLQADRRADLTGIQGLALPADRARNIEPASVEGSNSRRPS